MRIKREAAAAVDEPDDASMDALLQEQVDALASDDGVQVPLEQRTEIAEQLLKDYVMAGMGVGLLPVPALDFAALLAVQMKLLHALARVYSIEFRRELGRAAVGSLMTTALPVGYALPVAASAVKAVPVFGQGIGLAVMPVFNGAATYALGKVFIQHFEAGGTFLTFDPKRTRRYFADQFRAGKRVARAAKDAADASTQDAAQASPAQPAPDVDGRAAAASAKED